ncbi:hypothetical protein EV361DRAFT_911312 [Lentinula raphanica]|uniref:Yeast cell wall synthesis Kre9/Knh1-like N-terminal domain-containing protein n=1 Tax=Lentinula raphanica TaxID=153919 RepID=A0AA38PA27_9AGAR|nr:hypothetical protein C8R42DRAFT_678853 [Lentinula raphanica]KAJ3761425.1 hypothetical protein EV360DRAFT_37849 [Lentinula raphanica]KAJ3822414.1 hypothetical protein F5880DRAFT_682039 [Lentinula raphanica]KAJ3839104.1 hypothetical protein F5878DRAFT_561324 [Lentinula raphanica]KAJ3971455.1 hypothetical protein EV361DRAFT_911312 [Lentinula raphanica]
MFAKVVLLSALVSSALATVFITSPTSSSTFTAGQTATITWQDNNVAPLLAAWGNASVGIWTGNANQQTLLQQVVASVNVSTTTSIQFTPNASIGPNGQEYFIRMESLTLKDANNTQYPEMAFSALFTMASMTGTFNSSVSAEIAGQSTAPIGGSTTGSIAATTSAASSSAKVAAASTTASSKSTTASAASASNGAISSIVANIWISAFFGAVVLALML